VKKVKIVIREKCRRKAADWLNQENVHKTVVKGQVVRSTNLTRKKG
jgi:hypothetical protein